MKIFRLIVPAALIFSSVAFAQTQSPANQLRATYGEITIPDRFSDLSIQSSRVHDSYHNFVLALDRAVGNQPYSTHEFLGFSGAGYAEKDIFIADFKRAVISAVAETKARLGSNAMTILVLGGTVDGFGMGYDIIDDLKKSGQIKDVVVAGMVSDQAVKYHIDGVKNGYDVISPKQSHILVLKTYTENGQQSWEVKSSKTDGSKTVEILLRPSFNGPTYSVMHLMEGGDQAAKEAMEMMIESARAEKTYKEGVLSPEMRLYVGYREGKVAKMKGYKGATQMVRALLQFPQIKPNILKVTIQKAGAPQTVFNNVADFLRANPGALVDPNFILTPEQKSQIPAEEATIRTTKFQDAMKKTLDLLANQLNEGQARLSAHSNKINSWLDQPSHPINDNGNSIRGAKDTIKRNNEMESRLRSLETIVREKIAHTNTIADIRAQRAAQLAKGAGQSVKVEDAIRKGERSK